ncbi:efflux RND transporter permease subunit [Thalassoglobus polymorphus]|uniref:Cation efflux system protein CusA n=1 Tax=Thalassoglobus polymorphus TaxID=2527994 RepID=A0A517QKU9_9PLAN|nr:efflux RND transporter permease subunit [Thalassoglobus polymorphus]QDT32234.1 Cation efflux system protein CusA [Thalassoglobus polymorphus]
MNTDRDNKSSTTELPPATGTQGSSSFLDGIIRFCLDNKLVVALLVMGVIGWGVLVAPFDWEVGGLPRDPVPVDAIPDIGENQQIVFTEWMGRSPQDVEDQIGYPLTVSLLGLPGVKTVRSYSMFGFSSIYIIFDEEIDFYWSRSRVLEKLNSLSSGTLPEGVQPTLGPDATALGQIYWYTLEGRDPEGNPVGGWDLHELRTVQDWYVRYSLMSAEGVSEAASVGGFVQEYQIDVDPDAMRAFRVGLDDIFNAVRMSNVDVGARTIEVNRAEYVIRGLGFIKQVSDIEKSVIKSNDNVPVYIKDVAHVSLGPALRRGMLDKGGAESVGGVVVVRYGYNPLEAIKHVKDKIAEISPGLPTKAVVNYAIVSRSEVTNFAASHDFTAYVDADLNQEAWLQWLRANERASWPDWITTSQVTLVPFYDRAGLINETLGTLNSALFEEILVTIIVVIISVVHLRSSFLISALLPLAVLMCFIAMKTFGVDANIVALSGIAIAIGTMVDMGVVLCENILSHLDEADPKADRKEVIFKATSEVAGAVLTAVSTTVVSFLPVFTMTAAEGKLFRPLAFTKTFALLASVIVALTVIPPVAHVLFAGQLSSEKLKRYLFASLIIAGFVAMIWLPWWVGTILIAISVWHLLEKQMPAGTRKYGPWLANGLAVIVVGLLLTESWLPLGPEKGMLRNLIFVGVLIGSLMLFFQLFQRVIYAPLLGWCLRHKILFLSVPTTFLLMGGSAWLGFERLFSVVPWAVSKVGGDSVAVHESRIWTAGSDLLPGLGKEFMPPLDEGSFLYMPTTMPHASIGEVSQVLQLQNKALMAIPEVESAVGKLGRVESALDPAPVSMIETIINYKSEYMTDKDGHRIDFAYDEETEDYLHDENGELIPDPAGRPYRVWREHIKTPDDIWQEIVKAAEVPGTTSAPKLQPIAARIVMLQSGMRAPMGIKIKGPDLETIEKVALDMERFLKQVPDVEASAVIADRVVGKPYIEIAIDRDASARYGIMIRKVQDVIEVAIGGRRVTTTVEGRERYPVRIRYQRELRDSPEQLGRILVDAPDGTQIPLEQLAKINFVRGPQVIKSEDTFLIAYVLFDMRPGNAEVDVVEQAQHYLQAKIDNGELSLPSGVSYTFSGNYENQIRSQKTLAIVLPVALFVIFLILYLQFKDSLTTSIVFSGIIVAWAGGFIMIWLYGQPWFLDFSIFGTNMRTLFQVQPINLSVAIWVGFLALFGIASDDGVVISTYLDQSFRKKQIDTIGQAREATIEAGVRRVRPCLMTTATTILALIPILTSTGRGADIMIPMAIPSIGGMTIAIMTMLVVPVLYCWVKEIKLRLGIRDTLFEQQS